MTRRIHFVALCVALTAVVGCRSAEPAQTTVGSDATTPSLSVNELVLRSPQGKVLAKLAPNESGEACLTFFHSLYPDRVSMTVGLTTFGTPEIVLYDKTTQPPDEGCILKITNEGDPGEPMIVFTSRGYSPRPMQFKISATRAGWATFTRTVGDEETTLPFNEILRALGK